MRIYVNLTLICLIFTLLHNANCRRTNKSQEFLDSTDNILQTRIDRRKLNPLFPQINSSKVVKSDVHRQQSTAPVLDFQHRRSIKHNKHWLNSISDYLILYVLPIITCLGIIGNVFTIIIFFNSFLKKVPCWSYLAALSISDLGFLATTMIIIVSSSKIGPIILNFKGLMQDHPPYTQAEHPNHQTSISSPLTLQNIRARGLFNTNGTCQVLSYLHELFATLSVWIIVTFTIERFLVICKPCKGKTTIFPSYLTSISIARANKVILILVFFIGIWFSYIFVTQKVVTFSDAKYPAAIEVLESIPSHDHVGCDLDPRYQNVTYVLKNIETTIMLVVPLCIIVTCNILIARKLINYRTIWSHINRKNASIKDFKNSYAKHRFFNNLIFQTDGKLLKPTERTAKILRHHKVVSNGKGVCNSKRNSCSSLPLIVKDSFHCKSRKYPFNFIESLNFYCPKLAMSNHQLKVLFSKNKSQTTKTKTWERRKMLKREKEIPDSDHQVYDLTKKSSEETTDEVFWEESHRTLVNGQDNILNQLPDVPIQNNGQFKARKSLKFIQLVSSFSSSFSPRNSNKSNTTNTTSTTGNSSTKVKSKHGSHPNSPLLADETGNSNSPLVANGDCNLALNSENNKETLKLSKVSKARRSRIRLYGLLGKSNSTGDTKKRKNNLTHSASHPGGIPKESGNLRIGIIDSRGKNSKSQMAVTKMLLIVSTIFLIVHTPFHISRFVMFIFSLRSSYINNFEPSDIIHSPNATINQIKYHTLTNDKINYLEENLNRDSFWVTLPYFLRHISYAINVFLYSASGSNFRKAVTQVKKKMIYIILRVIQKGPSSSASNYGLSYNTRGGGSLFSTFDLPSYIKGISQHPWHTSMTGGLGFNILHQREASSITVNRYSSKRGLKLPASSVIKNHNTQHLQYQLGNKARLEGTDNFRAKILDLSVSCGTKCNLTQNLVPEYLPFVRESQSEYIIISEDKRSTSSVDNIKVDINDETKNVSFDWHKCSENICDGKKSESSADTEASMPSQNEQYNHVDLSVDTNFPTNPIRKTVFKYRLQRLSSRRRKTPITGRVPHHTKKDKEEYVFNFTQNIMDKKVSPHYNIIIKHTETETTSSKLKAKLSFPKRCSLFIKFKDLDISQSQDVEPIANQAYRKESLVPKYDRELLTPWSADPTLISDTPSSHSNICYQEPSIVKSDDHLIIKALKYQDRHLV